MKKKSKKLLFLFLIGLFFSENHIVYASRIVIPEKNIYFLSPHFDDVPLTFGGLIANGVFKNTNNIVVTFFGLSNYTINGPREDKSDKRINYVTNLRIQEDRAALTQLFQGWQNYKYIILGEREKSLRTKRPKNTAGGPSNNFSSFGHEEINAFNNIYNYVIPILKQKNTAVFVLSAIQSHIDHFIIREAVIKAVHDLGKEVFCQIYFGEDQPYAGKNLETTNKDIMELDDRLHLQSITYKIDIDKKTKIFSSNYYSQYNYSYLVSLSERAKLLNGGERIYKWNKSNYKFAKVGISCTDKYCSTK